MGRNLGLKIENVRWFGFSKQWKLHEEREKKALHCKDATNWTNLSEVNAAASLVSFPCARTGQQNVPAITIPQKIH